MKRSPFFLIALAVLCLSACDTKKSKSNEVVTVQYNLAGESLRIPANFKTSSENFATVIGGPQRIRLQTDAGYYVEIEEGVGKYSLLPASSAEDFGTNRVKSVKIMIAGKPFYKRPLYLYKDNEYSEVFSNDFGSIKLSSEGHVIDMGTGNVIDKEPRYLTEYVFDLGNNIFSIVLEDKIPDHEDLIKIILELDDSDTKKENVGQKKGSLFGKENNNSDDIIAAVKGLNENLVKVKNDYADVYSLILQGRPTVMVAFKSKNMKANLQAFMEIIDETATELVKKYKDYVYYAYGENELVLAYDGSPANQIFSIEGIHFYVDGKTSDISVTCPYRTAYADIVKEKRGVTNLTEWDYYMFRNKMPFDEKEDQLIGGPALLGTSALLEVAKTDWELVFSQRLFEEFIKIFEEREGIQDYVKKQGSYGIIWFDPAGKRVMAETIDKTQGETKRDRRWYNGYKMPE